VARRADRLEALAQKLSQAYPVKAEVIIADLANEPDLVRVERVLATNPAVHVLVNNAGLVKCRPVAESPPARFPLADWTQHHVTDAPHARGSSRAPLTERWRDHQHFICSSGSRDAR
jgi:NADP-dependent 3-hydroxy acid dehydrogenase YdfG